MELLKRLVKRTPLAPIARGLYRKIRPLSLAEVNSLYNWQTVEVMKRVVARGSATIDAGAHGGEFLGPMLSLTDGSLIHAFEPIPHLAAGLRRDFPAVVVHEVALGEQSGTATFHLVRNDPAYSGLRRRVYDRPDPEVEEITVEVRRLDDVLPADLRVAFIKMDVEGGEYGVMRGGVEIIRRHKPVIAFEAGAKSTGCYGVTPGDIADFLAPLGLSVSTMERWLEGRAPYSRREFVHAYERGSDFYWIAHTS